MNVKYAILIKAKEALLSTVSYDWIADEITIRILIHNARFGYHEEVIFIGCAIWLHRS